MFEHLIPSKDVRAYIQQIGFQFTDAELATIIYHAGLPLTIKHRYWEQLSDKTADVILRQQIQERIAYDHKCYMLFAENNGSYFYEVTADEATPEWDVGDVIGHFASLELAIDHTKKCGLAFSVRKYQIIGLCENIIVPCALFNPRLFPDGISEARPYRGESIAEYNYTADGVLRNFWTYEISPEETMSVEDWGKVRFEWKFIRMPNPFEEGDRVRIVGTATEGTVVTSQAEWQAFLRRVDKQHPVVDYMDASITVDYSTEEKPYAHEHVLPIYLERVDSNSANPYKQAT